MHSIYIPLQDRSLLSISGNDARKFLQGIISNDIEKVSPECTIYALLLTPQGKFLFDFFISDMDGAIIIDCASNSKDALVKRLMMYKLRSDVKIEDISNKYEVVALLGDNVFAQDKLADKSPGRTIKFCKGIAYIDPRDVRMYGRSVIERENNYQSFEAKDFELGNIEEYEKLRIELTIPAAEKELISGESFPLQNRLDEINAIDFEKGCYVGQEVTTRSKHRGNIRRTLYTVEFIEGGAASPGIEIITEDGKKAGTVLSVMNHLALAQLEKDMVEQHKSFNASDAVLKVVG